MRKRHTFVALAVGALLLAVLLPLFTAFLLSLGILLVPAVPVVVVLAVVGLVRSLPHDEQPGAPRRHAASPGEPAYA